jgi:hypothetical protein
MGIKLVRMLQHKINKRSTTLLNLRKSRAQERALKKAKRQTFAAQDAMVADVCNKHIQDDNHALMHVRTST